jgi:hypothetical protein
MSAVQRVKWIPPEHLEKNSCQFFINEQVYEYMLSYDPFVASFFNINNITNGPLYSRALGVLYTQDLEGFSDETLRNLWLTPPQFVELWTCKVFVQLHLGGWKWTIVMELLGKYRDEIYSLHLRNKTDTTGQDLYLQTLLKLGFSIEKPPKKKTSIQEMSKCQHVLDSLQSMMEIINPHLMPVWAPSPLLFNFLVEYKDMLGITEDDIQKVFLGLEVPNGAHVNLLSYFEKGEVDALACLDEGQKQKLWALITEYKRDQSYRKFVIASHIEEVSVSENDHHDGTHTLPPPIQDTNVKSRILQLLKELENLIQSVIPEGS